MSAIDQYHETLASCPASGGGVHGWIMRAANLAAFADVPAVSAVADITARMSRQPSPPSEVKDSVEKAYRERGAQTVGLASAPWQRTKKAARKDPATAKNFIWDGAGVTGMDYLEASPIHFLYGDEWWQDAIVQFKALFLPEEYVWCGEDQRTPGILGKTVRTREEWCKEFKRRGKAGEPLPTLFIANPVSPVPAKTKDGKPSLRCDASITHFRHAVAEMDEMELERQFEFWWGWGLKCISTVTFSGRHSLHVLLRVDAENRESWDKDVKQRLFDKLVALGCDAACRNPARCTRLAGAFRNDGKANGAVQKLWFAREELSA